MTVTHHAPAAGGSQDSGLGRIVVAGLSYRSEALPLIGRSALVIGAGTMARLAAADLRRHRVGALTILRSRNLPALRLSR